MTFDTSLQQAQVEPGAYESLGWKIVVGFVIVALFPPAIMFIVLTPLPASWSS